MPNLFAFLYQVYRGPIHVRWGPSTDFWWLAIETDKGHFVLTVAQNPLDNPEVMCYEEPGITKSMAHELLEWEGTKDVGPESKWNVSIDTPSKISLVNKGSVKVFEEASTTRKYGFESKSKRGEQAPLAGVFFFRREEKSRFWIMEQSKAPKEVAKRGRVLMMREKPKHRLLVVPLEPGDPTSRDAGRHYINKEEVRLAAERYLKDYRLVGYMHKREQEGVYVVQSWITDKDMDFRGQEGAFSDAKVVKGSWLVWFWIENEELWEAIKRGEDRAVSPGGTADVIPV